MSTTLGDTLTAIGLIGAYFVCIIAGAYLLAQWF